MPSDKINIKQKPRYWFIFQKDRLLMAKINEDHHLISDEHFFPELSSSFAREHLLIEEDHCAVYCAEVQMDLTVTGPYEWLPLRQALALIGPEWYQAATKAYSVINWDKNHQFCGRCGTQTLHTRLGIFERACPVCSLTFYPRISPSIIVLIHRQDQILMARSHHFNPGVYGLIAGFIEAGENAEEAVHREVKEEVGITIHGLRYFGTQSWPFPDSLMIAYFAEYEAGEIQINPTEIEEAGWFRFDALPGYPSSNISIAKKLIDHFVAQRKSKK